MGVVVQPSERGWQTRQLQDGVSVSSPIIVCCRRQHGVRIVAVAAALGMVVRANPLPPLAIAVSERKVLQDKQDRGMLRHDGSQVVPVHVFGGGRALPVGRLVKGALDGDSVVLPHEFGVPVKDGARRITQKAQDGFHGAGAPQFRRLAQGAEFRTGQVAILGFQDRMLVAKDAVADTDFAVVAFNRSHDIAVRVSAFSLFG